MDPYSEIELSEETYKKFADFIYKQSGIDLGINKQMLVKTRFQKRLRALQISSFESYYDRVVKTRDQDELVLMIDAISTNHTFFYREKDHFDYLSAQALPFLTSKKHKAGSKRFRAWCAAASSGDEPYTLMICMLEHFQSLPGWDVKLLATDISTKVLKKAQEGIYDHSRIKAVPPLLLDKYFDRVDLSSGKNYQVKDFVKRQIAFRRMNLMRPQFPFKGQFDFIFNRNVMIYFDKPTQEILVKKMLLHLAPEGFLFIGHSETITGPIKSQLKQLGPALFQKIS